MMMMIIIIMRIIQRPSCIVHITVYKLRVLSFYVMVLNIQHSYRRSTYLLQDYQKRIGKKSSSIYIL